MLGSKTHQSHSAADGFCPHHRGQWFPVCGRHHLDGPGFGTIARALGEAGFSLEDVVRARYIITDPAYQDAVFAVTGEMLGDIRPAATMIIAGLIRPEMKVEIEVTAKRRR